MCSRALNMSEATTAAAVAGGISASDETAIRLLKEVKQLVRFLRDVSPELAGKVELSETALLDRPDVLNNLREDVASAVQAAVKKLDVTDVNFVKSFFNLSTKDITKQYFVVINWLDTSTKRRGSTIVPFCIRGNVEAKQKRLERMNDYREAAAAARRKRKCFAGTDFTAAAGASSPTSNSSSSSPTSGSGSGSNSRCRDRGSSGSTAGGGAEGMATRGAGGARERDEGDEAHSTDEDSMADDMSPQPVRLVHPFHGQHMEKVEKPRGKCVFSTNEPLQIACLKPTIVVEGVAIWREMCTASNHTTTLKLHGRTRVVVDNDNIVGWILPQPMGGLSVNLPWQDMKRLNVFYPYCSTHGNDGDDDDDGDDDGQDDSIDEARSDAISLISVRAMRERDSLVARDNSTSMSP